MNFYSISILETEPSRYAWASGYGPIKPLFFLDSFSDTIREMKIASWKLNNDVPGISIDSGGREWSDILGCGGGPPSAFYSERIIQDLQEAEIPFIRSTEMLLGKINSKWLRKISPPNYFVLEAEPGMKIRSVSIPIEEQIAARNERPPRRMSPCRIIGNLDSWNGNDLFSPAHGKSLTALFCTDRVKELAERRGWTNAKFIPIETE